jgi:hypothetical protein
MLNAMASQVFPLAVIPSAPANGIHLVLHPVLAAPPGQRGALTAAIPAPATLVMAAGRLAADPREQPHERGTR